MYVIFGATGGIGGVVAQRLLEANEPVRVVGRSADRLASLTASGAEPYVIDDLLDWSQVAQAMVGAKAAYTMAPPISSDVTYSRVGEVMAGAATEAGVTHVVNLSALGADYGEAGGHTGDYTALENGFAKSSGLNVLHIRPCLFMTSFYGWISPIREKGQVSGLLRGDLGVPRIASNDTAQVVVEKLLALDFEGHSHRDLHGNRDLSMDEAASIIGRAIRNDGLRYVQVSPEEWFETQRQRFGRTPQSAKRMNLMYEAWNSGALMRSVGPRRPETTTSTTFEEFVQTDFLPKYKTAT